MSHWPLQPFNAIYAVSSRNGITRPKATRGSGYKMVNMGELFAYGRFWNPDMELVQLSDSEIERFTLKQGDLLFARQSLVLEGTGKCSIVMDVPETTCFESHLIRVRLDKQRVDPNFYYYYFGSHQGKANMQSLVMQVAAAGIRGSELALLQVPVPPFPTQQKVGAILSAYDDLIENNLRRIKILEEMAQNLYREWFVKFRFPGHQHTRFVDSPKGSIPEGWAVVKIKDVADVNARSIRKGTLAEIAYIDIASVSPGSIDKMEIMAFAKAPSRARRITRNGDIIWSSVRPNRRSFSLIIDPPGNLIVSTGFAVISAKKVPFTYLYQAATTDDFVIYLVNHAKGAAYPAVNADDFENANILVPCKQLLSSFDDKALPIAILTHRLKTKNTTLRRTRDLLLPRLISGEVDVSELDIAVPEEAEA